MFFLENLLGTGVEDGTVVVRLPLPADVALQLVAVSDIGTAAATRLLDPASAPESVELAGDELTGPQLAECIEAAAGLPARDEPLPLDALGDDEDLRAMFSWFATGGPDGRAYAADLEAGRALVPDLHSVASSGWSARG